jgi:hypothetical protein
MNKHLDALALRALFLQLSRGLRMAGVDAFTDGKPPSS